VLDNGVMIRVVIADDHQLLRTGLARMLRRDYEIVGEAADGDETIRAVGAARPDLLVLDLSMPRCDPTGGWSGGCGASTPACGSW